ncbi:MAG: hypothetical protein HKO07_00625, partial [Pseudomonadales bacterium]|nr:hypothetical protein [Pseudomonadales bacterium]
MKLDNEQQWLPPICETASGDERRVGVEIEYAGVDASEASRLLLSHFGGSAEALSRAEFMFRDTRLGDFKLELDANAVKQLAGLHEKVASPEAAPGTVEGLADSVGELAMDLVTQAAEQLVPWEIVSPPIPVSKLHQLTPLVSDLRQAGALGTRHALRYAFGVHLNPELPALDAATIVRYLRAYFVLYDWIAAQEQVDT